MRRLLLVAILLLIGTSAQPGTGFDGAESSPTMALLVHHPFPDDADPLGNPWPAGGFQDGYSGRYRHLDQEMDGFDFPHTTFDGVIPIEGIPKSSAPYVSTKEAYEAAFNERAKLPAPVALVIQTQTTESSILGAIQVEHLTDLTGNAPILFVALVEDPVHYQPPPALSNGVIVHPFVVRDMQRIGPATAGEHAFSFTIPAESEPRAWNPERMSAVAWVQQGGSDGLTLDAHEVAQAVIHSLNAGAPTRAVERTVLMEMYSATWCDTCLFGDTVAEEMAVANGIARPDFDAPSARYFSGSAMVPWALAAAIIVAVGVAFSRFPGEES